MAVNQARLRVVVLHGAHGGPDTNWFPWLHSALEAQGGSVKNLGRYAASWIAGWPNRPSSTAALT